MVCEKSFPCHPYRQMLDYTYDYTFEWFKETKICQEQGQQTTLFRTTNIPASTISHVPERGFILGQTR
jgi:hypothetical protein